MDDMYISTRINKAKSLGIPSFVTEFGSETDDLELKVKETDYIANELDQNF